MQRKRVLIIGGSFAGLTAARQLATATAANIDVCVVDPSPQFTWTPNIHELLSGVKQGRDVSLSRQQLLRSIGQRYISAKVNELNAEANTVVLDNGELLTYDACLVACGHVAADLNTAYPNHFGFRTARDIRRIHGAIERALAPKPAAAVTVSLVGAGFSGIEALGELLRRYRQHPRLKLQLIGSAPRLLSELPEVVGNDVQRLCQPFDVSLLLGQRVTDSSANSLTLADGSQLASDITIWTAGTRLPDFLARSPLAQDSAAGLPVDCHLQSTGSPAVFVAGDAAFVDTTQLQPGSKPLRKQSYHALDMGQVAGQNIQRWLADQPLTPYRPVNKPLLLAFGDLNTYLVMDDTVLASPLLATMKEAVYQLYMARLSSPLPLVDFGVGVASRYCTAVTSLALPELLRPRPLQWLRNSRLLQFGRRQDLLQLVKATQASLLQ